MTIFSDLQQSHQDEIKKLGYDFLQGILSAYGQDEAFAIWDKCCDAFDPSFKHSITTELLNTKSFKKSINLVSYDVTRFSPNDPNAAIKEYFATSNALQRVTTLSFNEAIKVTTKLVTEHVAIRVTIQDDISLTKARDILHSAGIITE